MPKIVGKAKRLGEIFVEAESARHRPPNLRDFKAVGQADAKMVAIRRNEHLRLVAQAAERGGMNDPVAVPLEGISGTSWPAIIFIMEAAARRIRGRCQSPQSAHQPEIFSIFSRAGLRVQVKLSMPAPLSLFTSACAWRGLSNGPTSKRK